MPERGVMPNMDIKVYLGNLKNNSRFTDEMLQLVEKDLRYGLTREETEEYTKKKLDYAQMKVYSKCLRSGYEKEVIAVIAGGELSGEQMAVALEFYEKGVPLDVIKEVAGDSAQTAYAMKKLFQSIIKKLEETQKKEIMEKIDLQEKHYDVLHKKIEGLQTAGQDDLRAQLLEKDKMMEEQQERINRARVEMAKLREELDAAEKEKIFLEEKIAGIEQKGKDAEPAAPVSELSSVSPGEYHAALIDKSGQILRIIPVEYMERKKSSGVMTSLFSRICLKKKIDIVRLVAERGLEPKQLVQIRSAIEKGLTEKQLMVLINNELPAEQMAEIINIAVYENILEGGGKYGGRDTGSGADHPGSL